MKALEVYERELARHVISLTQDSVSTDQSSTEENLDLLAKIRSLSDEKVHMSGKISEYEFQISQSKQKISELESSLNLMKLNQKIEAISEVNPKPLIGCIIVYNDCFRWKARYKLY